MYSINISFVILGIIALYLHDAEDYIIACRLSLTFVHHHPLLVCFLYFLLIEVHFILHFHCLLIITLYFTHVHVFTAIIIDDSFVTVHGAAEGEELVQLGDRRGGQ